MNQTIKERQIMSLTFYLSWLALIIVSLSSCKKYLSAKSEKDLSTPTTVQGLQGLLDYQPIINEKCSDVSGAASDNYFLDDITFAALPDNMKEAYLWQDGMFKNTEDWRKEYSVVYNANVVLDNINHIVRNTRNASAWDNCKGSALVFRAKSFYEIAQIWTKAYDSTTAETDLGIPLRLTSNFNVKSVRSTLGKTYKQITSDLRKAIPLLPDLPVVPFRASKCSAYGLLARTYLTMGDYVKAGLYADSCLKINSKLIDYNTLDTTTRNPFPVLPNINPEDIMHSRITGLRLNLYYLYTSIDTVLLSLYAANDLRKTCFFKQNKDGSYYFRGSYDGSVVNYNGLATDEVFLIKAECLAREGNISSAMTCLNTLLIKRFKTSTFVPYTADNVKEALKLILTERRKELIFRMLRFTDIKRLNKLGANITLKRIVNGKTYLLPPNDPRYALPIPEVVIKETSMQQN